MSLAAYGNDQRLGGGGDVLFWGRNSTIGTTIEDLNPYDQPTDQATILTAAGAKLDVTSASAADTNSAGTGGRKLLIYGCDVNLKPLTETLNLNGQTIVQSAGTYRYVFGIDVVDAGTGLVNAGDIHCVKTGTGGSYTAGVPGTLTSAICKMLAGWGASQTGIWVTPPSGDAWELVALMACARAQAGTVLVMARSLALTDVGLKTIFPQEIGANGTIQAFFRDMGMRICVPPSCEIRLKALGAAASAIITAVLSLKKLG
jgi:hypothetical protein